MTAPDFKRHIVSAVRFDSNVLCIPNIRHAIVESPVRDFHVEAEIPNDHRHCMTDTLQAWLAGSQQPKFVHFVKKTIKMDNHLRQSRVQIFAGQFWESDLSHLRQAPNSRHTIGDSPVRSPLFLFWDFRRARDLCCDGTLFRSEDAPNHMSLLNVPQLNVARICPHFWIRFRDRALSAISSLQLHPVSVACHTPFTGFELVIRQELHSLEELTSAGSKADGSCASSGQKLPSVNEDISFASAEQSKSVVARRDIPPPVVGRDANLCA
jgi:hypothetical protein